VANENRYHLVRYYEEKKRRIKGKKKEKMYKELSQPPDTYSGEKKLESR